MTTLKRGDIFLLQSGQAKSYMGFVKGGRERLQCVLFDDESKKLKLVDDASSWVNKITLISKDDIPQPLLNAYIDCFSTIKKGATVEFTINDVTYTGIVVKGGTKVVVEIDVDGNKLYSKGPAHSYTVLSSVV